MCFIFHFSPHLLKKNIPPPWGEGGLLFCKIYTPDVQYKLNYYNLSINLTLWPILVKYSIQMFTPRREKHLWRPWPHPTLLASITTNLFPPGAATNSKNGGNYIKKKKKKLYFSNLWINRTCLFINKQFWFIFVVFFIFTISWWRDGGGLLKKSSLTAGILEKSSCQRDDRVRFTLNTLNCWAGERDRRGGGMGI